MMKLTTENGKDFAVEEYNTPGLMEFSVRHEIKEKSSVAFISWEGPKIPIEEWQRVLSFFKWTYDTTKSESQVRLFVNIEEKTWRAWAFPQELQSGMTTTEIHNEAFQQQRQQFDEKWVLFGTVHHHCSASAFQSGADENNEKNQDGLHVTIGNMDKPLYDLHARFYRKSRKFDPDMSWFIDVSPEVESIPEAMIKYLPKGMSAAIARDKMCQPSTVEFPAQWKANMIERPKEERPLNGFRGGYQLTERWGGSEHGAWHPSNSEVVEPRWQKARNAWREILSKLNMVHADYLLSGKPTAAFDAVIAAQHEMDDRLTPYGIVAYALHHHGIDPDDLTRELGYLSILAGADGKGKGDEKSPVPPKLDEPKEPAEDAPDSEWEAYAKGIQCEGGL